MFYVIKDLFIVFFSYQKDTEEEKENGAEHQADDNGEAEE